jgi:hypothetical protein
MILGQARQAARSAAPYHRLSMAERLSGNSQHGADTQISLGGTMKIQSALSACIVLLLSGCASYSGNTYRQDIVYQGDGSYDTSDTYPQDDSYYGETYYDDSYDDGFYGGGNFSFGFGYGDPFYYGNRYGYCSPRYAFCPGDPLAVFAFPIGGGRYWLLFDGYDNRSYYYGGGYGYGWPYSYWGYPHDHNGDWDHHHHHHHDHDNPPDPVVVTPPPNGWVPSPRDGRQFLTPHPRKGVFMPNGSPRPRQDVGDNENTPGPTPRDRSNDGSDGNPPMRWRPPTMTTGPVDGTPQVRTRPDPANRPIQVAPSDQTRVYASEPPRGTRLESSEPVDRPTRSVSTPDPPTTNVPNRDSNDDSSSRIRQRVERSGGG